MNITQEQIKKLFGEVKELAMVMERIPHNAGGAGFAVSTDGESCFVGKNYILQNDLKEGDFFTARVAPNAGHHIENTPHKVIGNVSLFDGETPFAEASPKVKQAALEDRIMALMRVEEHAYPHKVGELASKLTADAQAVQLALQRMHNAGEVWEAKIERKGTQTKASYVLWALDDEWFAFVDYE
jgi:hypothetical protein